MDTDKIKERFTVNSRGFCKTYRWILLIYMMALTADGISTIRFMMAEGADTELHPPVNLAARIADRVLGPLIGVIGKTVAGVIAAIYMRRSQPSSC